jgi:hypothetical protein
MKLRPLCGFSGVEIPVQEFLQANDREALWILMWKLIQEASWRVMGGLMKGLVGVGVALTFAI